MSAHTAFRSLLKLFVVAALLVVSAPIHSPIDSASAVPTDMGTVTANLRCVTFVDSATGYAAGSSGVIIKTTDAGNTWYLARSGGAGDDYDLRSISFLDANNGWAISLTGR
ncbi:MAG: WD40/YVTN/BNR-like repeat-containing protein, partial [Coriobacteriia bacterium]